MTSISTTPSTAVKQQPAQPPPSTQEFSIRVPKTKKKHSVMRFNGVLKVNFKEWKNVKLERENNLRDPRDNDEEIPKFGAGSEFGREAREEARKKKFGMISRKYKSEDQPWILKVNGKSGRKFRGVREGGISDNAAYYVFSHAPDGAIEAYRLNEWYNFQIIQRYKALSAEEAEEEFNKRNRVLNYFHLMMKKRCRNDDEEGEDGDMLDGEKKKKKPGKKDKDFKISEMEDWIDSDDDNDSDSDDKDDKNESGDDKKDKKKKKKKKKNVSDNEAFEDSDDGDEEGRELDYISDSSASESELESQKEMKSVAEEDALRKLLASDEEDEDEQSDKKDDEDASDDEDGKNKEEKEKDKVGKTSDKKKDSKKKPVKKESGDSSSDDESVSETNKSKDDKKPASIQNSRAPTPTAGASTSSESLKRNRKDSPDSFQAKRVKTESNYSLPSSFSSSSSETSGITEDAVRRYLMRKPMTTTELLQKFKSKKTGLSSEQIVVVMTKILKNINPKSQKVKDKMYFSIKSPHRQQLPR